MWSHREDLLKVARRRSPSVQDAEDAVHEAMVRALERPQVDSARLGAWLTSVTVRLCIDRFRQINREDEVHTRSALTAPKQATLQEAVCDRAEAIWLSGCAAELPVRQAEALRLKAEGLEVTQIARQMGLSYRAVASLLARGRQAMRAALAGTLALATWVWRGRPGTNGSAQGVSLVSTTLTLAVVFAVPAFPDIEGTHPYRPGPEGTASQAAFDRDDLKNFRASDALTELPAGTDPGGVTVPPRTVHVRWATA